jgi:hypothetical protein
MSTWCAAWLKHRAAALPRVELLGAAQPYRKSVKLSAVIMRTRPTPPSVDDAPRERDRRVERMAVADDQAHPGARARVDHRPRIGERQCRGFSHSTCLPAADASATCARVVLVRRRDVDDLDVAVAHELLDARVRAGRRTSSPKRLRASSRGSGRRDQRDAPRRCETSAA